VGVDVTQRWALAGRGGTVLGAALSIVLIVGGLLVYPAAYFGGGPEVGPSGALLALGLLIVYAAAAVASSRTTSESITCAVGNGTRIGLVVGAVWLLSHTIEVFTDAGSAPSLLSFGTVFLLFGVAGLLGVRRTGRVHAGVLTAVWAAMSSTVILVAYGVLVTYLFMSRLEAIDAPDFARSAMHDAAAFTVANTVFSASSHLLVAPAIAAVFGTIGSVAGWAWFLRKPASAPPPGGSASST
jgi:hypothetical protein